MKSALLEGQSVAKPRPSESDVEETEDEEVKLNCIGGKSGVHNSEFSSDGEDHSDEEDLREEKKDAGVVEFVNRPVQKTESAPPVCRPKPVASRTAPPLSPHAEESNESSSEDSESDNANKANEDEDCVISAGNPRGSPAPEYEKEEIKGFDVKIDKDKKIPTPRSSILQHLESLNSKISPIAPRNKYIEDPWMKSTKAKRVLSSNTLAALNAEAGRNADSPKRIRCEPMAADMPPELSLGESQMDNTCPLPRESLMRDSPGISSDEEDLDKTLSEELKRLRSYSIDNSPVPLLTPPQSPVTINIGESAAACCEWPSNLVVDSALMTAATDTRPLSPATLQKFEEAEEKRFAKDASSLTPLLQSIYVGTE